MIGMLGTSNMLGGHDQNGSDPNTMLHNMLSNELGCDVLNLSTPGRAVERYAQNLLYAHNKYKPSLFICELFIDRSFNNFWFPTDSTMSLIKENAETIHQSFIEERFSWKEDRIDNRYIKSRINRNTQNTKNLTNFQECLFQIEPIDKLLDYYKKSCVYIDDEYLCSIRTIDTMFHLELLAKSLGIDILYLALFEPAIAFNKAFIDTLPTERFLNNFYKITNGVDEILSEKCQGNHLSYDNDHFNEKADKILIKDFIAPFIKHYSEKHKIQL